MQLIQVYSQKSTRTTFPRNCAKLNGGELNQSFAWKSGAGGRGDSSPQYELPDSASITNTASKGNSRTRANRCCETTPSRMVNIEFQCLCSCQLGNLTVRTALLMLTSYRRDEANSS